MTDIILEVTGACFAAFIIATFYSSFRTSDISRHPGSAQIVIGFGLIFFSLLIDITDNFPGLNFLIVVGDTEVQAFLEKAVGSLGGLLFLAWGFKRWIPSIIEAERMQERLHILATTDELTGLHNRRQYNTDITEALNHSQRLGTDLLLAIGDIDHFKKYNDLYGHPEGDEALRLIGRVLRETTRRTTEIAYRIGGEEFAVIAQVKNKGEGEELIKLIMQRLAVEQLHITNSLAHSPITLSFGLGFASDCQNPTPEKLYRLADKVLYEAKRDGRNRFSMANASV